MACGLDPDFLQGFPEALPSVNHPQIMPKLTLNLLSASLLAFVFISPLSAQDTAQAGAASAAGSGVRYEESPSDDTALPMYLQVAPSSKKEMRLPGSPEATTRHFSGDDVHPVRDSLVGNNFPEVDNQLSQMDPFFRDTSLDLNLRTVFFRTENKGKPLASAWSLGGSLIYESGWFKDFFNIGAGYYTASGLYKPYGQDGTLLLKGSPDGGQHSINVLGQAYAQFKYDVYRLKVYRQALDTPFINEHFDRSTPQLFEAYMIGTKNLVPDESGMGFKPDPKFPVNFTAGYVAEELNRGATTFVPMSSVATGNTTSLDRGVAMGGLQVSPFDNTSVSLWEYYGVDMFNTLYAEADTTFAFESVEGLDLKLAAQFADQRDVGESIVGNWSTQMIGLMAGASYQGLALSFRYNQNFGGVGTNPAGATTSFGMASPWGRFPAFNKSTVSDYREADMSAYGIWASWDAGQTVKALDGLKFAVSYVIGTLEASSLKNFKEENELDFILKYKVPQIKGLAFEFRSSYVSFQDRPGTYTPAINDYRAYCTYSIPLL